jgi:hypothetical protein
MDETIYKLIQQRRDSDKEGYSAAPLHIKTTSRGLAFIHPFLFLAGKRSLMAFKKDKSQTCYIV